MLARGDHRSAGGSEQIRWLPADWCLYFGARDELVARALQACPLATSRHGGNNLPCRGCLGHDASIAASSGHTGPHHSPLFRLQLRLLDPDGVGPTPLERYRAMLTAHQQTFRAAAAANEHFWTDDPFFAKGRLNVGLNGALIGGKCQTRNMSTRNMSWYTMRYSKWTERS